MTVFAENPELLPRFRAGDRDALSDVYWFYVARVESVVRRGLQLAGPRTAGRVRSDVADLVQDVFVRAFARSARVAYDDKRPYAPLLLTIARNALVDHIRRQGREHALASPHIERLLNLEPPEEPRDAPWADAQTIAVVSHYVAALPAPQRAVYVQRYCQGRSQLQAADALGLTRQQVRTLEGHVRDGLVRELARVELAAGTGLGPSAVCGAPRFAEAKGDDR